MTILLNDLEIRNNILQHFDFAFAVDWNNEHHKKIHKHLLTLTMYHRMKFNGHFDTAGSYLAYKFNTAGSADDGIKKIKNLLMNESPDTFSEENINGCSVFKV